MEVLELVAVESTVSTLTLTSGYAAFAASTATGADDISSMGSRGEFNIVTATGSTSAPTLGDDDDDSASVFVAVKEVAVAGGATPVQIQVIEVF